MKRKRVKRRHTAGNEKHMYNRINSFESGGYMAETQEILLFQELLDKGLIYKMGDKFQKLAYVFLMKGLIWDKTGIETAVNLGWI